MRHHLRAWLLKMTPFKSAGGSIQVRLCLAAALLWGTGSLTWEGSAAPKRIRIKLATLAPEGTSYHVALERMARKWHQASHQRYRINIYPGGVQGGESAMVQRMRINSLQGGLLTANGLAKAVPEVNGLQSIPMMFRSLEEMEYVNAKLRPRIEGMLRAKGFVVLFWGDAGWVRFFSKTPVQTPDDLRKLKLFTWAGDIEAEKIYRSARLQPVPMETSEILTGLKTGFIEAVAMPPFAANANMIYQNARHMLELNWAPMVGALVINTRSWDAIPADLQTEFRQAANEAKKTIVERGRQENEEAVQAMKTRWGLQVQSVTPALEKLWRTAAEEAYPMIRGQLVPADIFDEVKRLLEKRR